MFGGKVGVPMVHPHARRGAGAQLTAQHSQSLEVMFAHTPGPEGRRAVDAARRLRAAQDRDPRRRPRRCSSRTSCSTTSRGDAAGAGRGLHGADRPGRGRARGRRPDDRRPLLHGAPRAGRRRPARDSTASRSRSSTCARCARWTSRRSPPACAQDQPRARRRGGLGDLRRRRGGRSAHLARGLLRRPRRAGRAGRRRRGADAVRQAARARRARRRGEDRGGRARLLAELRLPLAGGTDGRRARHAAPERHDGAGHDRALARSTRATRSPRATCSPRSRPTRR